MCKYLSKSTRQQISSDKVQNELHHKYSNLAKMNVALEELFLKKITLSPIRFFFWANGDDDGLRLLNSAFKVPMS